MDNSRELPGEEDARENVLKRTSSSVSLEDGEIRDKPSRKKNKAGVENFTTPFDGSKEENEEVDADEIQVTCEIIKREGRTITLPQKKGNPASSLSLTDDLARANKRIVELQNELDGSKGMARELERANAKATQLERLFNEATKKIRIAESRAESAENLLAAVKPVGDGSKWPSEEFQAKIKEQDREISFLKEKLKSVPVGGSINEVLEYDKKRLMEKVLENDKKRLMKEVEENEKRKREDLGRSVNSLEQGDNSLTLKESIEKNRSDAASGSDGQMANLTERMKDLSKEVAVTREINNQIATIALETALKEIAELKIKNLKLEEQVRLHMLGSNRKEMEDLKKRNALLMKDNIELRNNKKAELIPAPPSTPIPRSTPVSPPRTDRPTVPPRIPVHQPTRGNFFPLP